MFVILIKFIFLINTLFISKSIAIINCLSGNLKAEVYNAINILLQYNKYTTTIQ